MNGDMLRWFGTTFLAACFGLVALAGIIYLAASGRPIPDVLTYTALASGGMFFAVFGGMVGARATQNGVQVAAGQAPTGEGMH